MLEIATQSLAFADDLLIFSAASVNSAMTIKKVLNDFAEILGLKGNPSKSSMFFSGVNKKEKVELLRCL